MSVGAGAGVAGPSAGQKTGDNPFLLFTQVRGYSERLLGETDLQGRLRRRLTYISRTQEDTMMKTQFATARTIAGAGVVFTSTRNRTAPLVAGPRLLP